MRTFSFRGEIPASKSLMNRALVIQSYFPQIQIKGDSNCDDVRHMKTALASFGQNKDIFCGEAGTVIRFLGLRVARETGTFKLTGTPRLLKRPQQDLVSLLEQLSVQCQLKADHILIQGQGWRKPSKPLQVDRETSSQFATSLILNSWNLPFDLEFEMRPGVSEGYFEMSLEMVQALGMKIEHRGDFWKIPAHQKLQTNEIQMEPDYSSAFGIAVAGALAGHATIANATERSTQPDFEFISLMKQMQIPIELHRNELTVEKTERISPLEVDLANSPDLFPVLSVLCAFADGESNLKGAPHLSHKESNRIEKTAELLRLAGFDCSVRPDGMRIKGKGLNPQKGKFEFDPDQDHRMAMAAGLLKLKGFDIQIHHPEVVSKSFPEFWQALGVEP